MRFEKHKKTWFINRVGQLVQKEYTRLTPAAEQKDISTNVVIDSEKHAEALYNYHLDKKVNFKE